MEASKKSKICDFGGVKVQNLRFSPLYIHTRSTECVCYTRNVALLVRVPVHVLILDTVSGCHSLSLSSS